MGHRGPDGTGTWISPDVGMAHARLAMVGLNNGAQPLANEDRHVRAIVNGEFYDFEKVRRDLMAAGHSFNTDSDSEILIHAYEEHGVGCLRFLRGEFAFVLWDDRKKTLFAARDRFGIKPLCYLQENSELWIASEAKAIFAAGATAAWDHESFFHAMSTQYTLPDRTLFAGIKQLRPGHFLIATRGKVRTECYWDLDYASPALASKAEPAALIEEFRERLDEAITLRLRCDAPLCFHLSGGLDSSAIVGMAARHGAKPFHTFSVSFESESYDEIELARESAKHCGAILHTVRISQDELIEALPDAVYFSEGLAVNGHLPAKYLLNRAIHDAGFKAALTGEGSDEIVAGYPHLRVDLFRSENRGDLLDSLIAANPASRGIMLPHGGMLPLNAVRERLGFVPSFLEAKASLGLKLQGFLSDDFKHRYAGRDAYSDFLDSANLAQLSGRHAVDQSAYLWTKSALANYILKTLGDGAEMAHSVEGRVPFLDHPLFEFSRSLPMSMKINDGIEKYILREAVRPFATDAIYRRRKHPFLAPPISRFSGSKADVLIQDTLRSKAFASMPFFDTTKVLSLLDSRSALCSDDQTALDPVLMTLLSAAILNERYHLP